MQQPPRPYSRGSVLTRLAEIKEWRTKEFDAGRPSSIADFCRAHGFCPDCHATGLARNANGRGHRAVALDGETRLYEVCEVCAGTGKLTNSANSR